jgi:hypothetical protein
VTITLHAEPQQMPGSMADYTEEEMARRLKQDLARLKELIESNWTGAEAAARHNALQGMETAARDPGMEAAGTTKQTVQPQPVRPGGNAPTSTVVGSTGGTDAAAGAQLSGSKGGPGGPSPRKTTDASGAPGATAGASPAPGAGVAGGTGLGSTASASDTRSGTGSTAGTGTTLTGGGTSGARDAGVSSGKGRTP